MLWQLPVKQADRIAPKITTAWHGRVYGGTDHGAIALDARNGKDLLASFTSSSSVCPSVWVATGGRRGRGCSREMKYQSPS
nr:hypothetical protein [Streptomyces griseochromogenes]